MLKSMSLMDTSKEIPTWEALLSTLCGETFSAVNDKDEPFFYLTGNLLYIWLLFDDLDVWAREVQSTIPDYLSPWRDRMDHVVGSFTDGETLNNLLKTSEEMNVPISAALAKLLFEDFCISFKIDKKDYWNESVHASAVVYLSLFFLLLWIKDADKVRALKSKIEN